MELPQFDGLRIRDPNFDEATDVGGDEILVSQRLQRSQHPDQVVVSQANYFLLRALVRADRDQVA